MAASREPSRSFGQRFCLNPLPGPGTLADAICEFPNPWYGQNLFRPSILVHRNRKKLNPRTLAKNRRESQAIRNSLSKSRGHTTWCIESSVRTNIAPPSCWPLPAVAVRLSCRMCSGGNEPRPQEAANVAPLDSCTGTNCRCGAASLGGELAFMPAYEVLGRLTEKAEAG